MGNRNRSAAHVDAGFDQHLNEMMIRPTPITLTSAELALDQNPPREAPPGEGIAVSAWVRFPEVPVLVTAVAVKWTDAAILVRWEAGDGRTLEAWVWKGAATRR